MYSRCERISQDFGGAVRAKQNPVCDPIGQRVQIGLDPTDRGIPQGLGRRAAPRGTGSAFAFAGLCKGLEQGVHIGVCVTEFLDARDRVAYSRVIPSVVELANASRPPAANVFGQIHRDLAQERFRLRFAADSRRAQILGNDSVDRGQRHPAVYKDLSPRLVPAVSGH
jgi:hypothetical protein